MSCMERYSLQKVIGEGSFSRGLIVQCKITHAKNVVKEIQLPKVYKNIVNEAYFGFNVTCFLIFLLAQLPHTEFILLCYIRGSDNGCSLHRTDNPHCCLVHMWKVIVLLFIFVDMDSCLYFHFYRIRPNSEFKARSNPVLILWHSGRRLKVVSSFKSYHKTFL